MFARRTPSATPTFGVVCGFAWLQLRNSQLATRNQSKAEFRPRKQARNATWNELQFANLRDLRSFRESISILRVSLASVCSACGAPSSGAPACRCATTKRTKEAQKRRNQFQVRPNSLQFAVRSLLIEARASIADCEPIGELQRCEKTRLFCKFGLAKHKASCKKRKN